MSLLCKICAGALSSCVSASQTRHLSFVAEFSRNVQHVSGKNNVVADALSRAVHVSAVLSPDLDYKQLAVTQTSFDEIKEFQTSTT